jgi:membrane fusion protein (multidrug efflux system)
MRGPSDNRYRLVLLITFAASACSETGAKGAASAPPPAAVVLGVVRRQDVPIYVTAVATVTGYIDAEIRARVRGFLQAQRYKDGGNVKAGDLLFLIEPAEYQAAMAAARANLGRAETGQMHNQASLDRRQKLIASKVVSEQELEDAQASARDSGNQIEAARAQLEQARLNLSYTQIRSPITGLAGLALVRAGNLVGQDGPTLLTTVSQVDPMRVTFPLGEVDYVSSADRLRQLQHRDLAWARRQFPRLDRGDATDDGDPGLELLLADGKPYQHRGVLLAANRQVDQGTGTIQMQALFPNPDNLLRPGQYGRVRMRRPDAGGNALVVPESALVQVQGQSSLAVVGPDNRVHLRRVEVGSSAGPLRIITSGVEPGERVVQQGVQKVSDGALVAPQPASQPRSQATR